MIMAPAFARAIEYAAVSSVVIPAERAAREPGSQYPCRALFLMPGYFGPGSAAEHFVLRCARGDSRDTCDAFVLALMSWRGRRSRGYRTSGPLALFQASRPPSI